MKRPTPIEHLPVSIIATVIRDGLTPLNVRAILDNKDFFVRGSQMVKIGELLEQSDQIELNKINEIIKYVTELERRIEG